MTTNGWDADSCGWEEISCLSITAGVERAVNVNITSVVLGSGIHSVETSTSPLSISSSSSSSSPFSFTGADITSDGELTTTKNVSGTPSPFMILSVPVTISRVKFVFTGTDGMNSSFIISTSHLTLEGVEFSNILLSNSPLLNVLPTVSTLTLQNSSSLQCHFNNITRESGNGSVFEVEVADKGEVTLSNAAFTNCTSGENGSDVDTSIYLSLKGVPSTFSLTALTFNSNPHNIYIHCLDGTKFLPSATFTGTVDSYESTSDSFYLVEETSRYNGEEEEGKSIPLSHFLFPPSSASMSQGYSAPSLVISDDNTTTLTWGVEIESCGWSDVPCTLIATAYSHLQEIKKKKKNALNDPSSLSITLLSGTSTHTAESSSTTFSQIRSLNIAGEKTIVSKEVTSIGDGVDSVFIIEDSTVTFERINFLIIDTSYIPSVFSLSSGTLNLTSLSLYPQSAATSTSTLSISLITLTAGTFYASCLSVENISLSTYDGAVLNVNASSVDVSITNSTFTCLSHWMKGMSLWRISRSEDAVECKVAVCL